jgi:hypothetical protein
MARILRLVSDSSRTHKPGSVDPPKVTLIPLSAVAERAEPLQRTAASWRARVQSSGRRRFADGPLVHVRTPGGQPRCGTTLSIHSASRGSTFRSEHNSLEPPWYGPICPVVWEGRCRETPPYPGLRSISRPSQRPCAQSQTACVGRTRQSQLNSLS